MTRRQLLLGVILASPVGPAWGQDAPVPRLVELRLAQVRTLSAIRVETSGGARVSGRLVGVGGGTVRLVSDGDTAAVASDVVQRVWRRRRATVAGAVVGGAIGIGVGIFYGLLAAAVSETGDSPAGYAAVGGLVVGAGGALVGAAVGAAIPRWSTIYP